MKTTQENMTEKLPKGLYQRARVYYIDFSYVTRNGVRKRVRQAIGENKKLALTVLAKKKVEAKENKLLDIRRFEKVRFRDFAQTYLERHAFKNKGLETDKHQLKAVNRFIGDKHLHEITVFDLETFRSDRLKEVKPATVNRNMALIKSILNRAVDWGKLQQELNPAPKIKKLPENNMRLRFLSKEEIERLYAHCDGELLALVQVAINTGMRRGELMALTWNDVDINSRQIYVRDSKSGNGRVIPMNENVRSVLLSLKKLPDSPNIFASNHREAFEAAIKKAGLKDVTFHTLRHTAASHLAQAGVNLLSISKILGHSTTQMTARYAHLSPDYQAKAISVLDRVLGVRRIEHVTNTAQEAIEGEVAEKGIDVTRLLTVC